ncbi:prolipoprotein diacylglyceryl transferase [Caproicibacterium sp. NSD3]
MQIIHNVTFPKMGITLQVNEIAFTIGSKPIYWYGIIIATGLILAILYTMKSCKKFHVNSDHLIDCILVGVIGGVIGARAYYVIFYPGDKYIKDPSQIFRIWEGGLGIYGGIIVGLLCGALMAKHHKMSVPAVLDLASMGFLIGQGIGRWGNFINQEAFGIETNLPWGMQSDMTRAFAPNPVHPCFLYESLWCLIGFLLLHFFSRKRRRYDGQVFLLYSGWYGLGRFFIEGLRTDSLLLPIVPLRVSQVVAAAAVVVSIILLIVFRNRTSLSGCGAPEIVSLNHLVDEIPEDMIESETEQNASSETVKDEKSETETAETNESAQTVDSDKQENSASEPTDQNTQQTDEPQKKE